MQQRSPELNAVKKNLAELFSQYLENKNEINLANFEDAFKSDHEGINDPVKHSNQTMFQVVSYCLLDMRGLIKVEGQNYNTLRMINDETLKRILILLLQNGASIDFAIVSVAYDELKTLIDPSLVNYFLNEMYLEMLIRGEMELVHQKMFHKFTQPSVEDIVKRLDDRKLKQKQLNDVKRLLNVLVRDGLYDDQHASAIYKKLEIARDISIDPSEYPACLSTYLSEEYKKYNTDSIISIFLQLQHARNVIPSPFTKEHLQQQIALYQNNDAAKQLLEWTNHPDNYDLKQLDEFLYPKNHMKSLLEMRFYPGIINYICMLAVHPDASVDVKNKAVALLHHMENLTDVEQAILTTGEANYNSAQIIATDLDELKSEVEELKPLKKQVEVMSSRLASLEKQMLLMSELMKPNIHDNTKSVGKTGPGLF
jgi:hypothetical protein